MKIKGVRLHGKKDLRLDEFELPEMKEDELLLKIISDSICMSTYKAYNAGEDHIRVPNDINVNPIITGHEFAGVIAKVGEKWKNEFKEGERFAPLPAIPGQMGSPGYSYPFFGGDCTYCIVPNDVIEKGCILHYKGDSFYEVSTTEPIFCCVGGYNACYHTIDECYDKINGTKAGGNVAILAGCGPMGLGAISYGIVRENGPRRIVVTEVNEDRLNRAKKVVSPEYAKEHGVELIYVNPNEHENEVEYLRSLTDNEGFDDVFIFTPIRSVCETGNKIMAIDGCMNLFAGPVDKSFSAEINLYDCHYNKTKIIGSSGGYMSDLKAALDLVAAKKVNPAIMLTHIGGIDACVPTTINAPKIPGGKKLIYTQFDMPLTAIDDFRKLGETDELYRKLADACDAHNGLWNKEAEDILLAYHNVTY